MYVETLIKCQANGNDVVIVVISVFFVHFFQKRTFEISVTGFCGLDVDHEMPFMSPNQQWLKMT